MANLQRAAGVPIEPSRSYFEQTMRWLGDYMGAVTLVLGLAGFTYACVRAVDPERVELRVALPLAVIATTVYALQPAAFPDQPWVMRRFAPEVIPLLLVFAAWLLSALERRRAGASRAAGRVVVAAALVVVAPLAVLRPVARANAGHRNQDVIHALCDQIGPDAAVLVGGGAPASIWYPRDHPGVLRRADRVVGSTRPAQRCAASRPPGRARGRQPRARLLRPVGARPLGRAARRRARHRRREPARHRATDQPAAGAVPADACSG